MDKIGDVEVRKELMEKVGLADAVALKITHAMSAKTIDEFAAIADVGESDDVQELRRLFELATEYGYGDWLQFDASVVRGLAYYTGVVFEGFDKAGVLRAICGGGRYDRLLSLYGAPKEVPCVGFGFGDCVVVELLKEKKVSPSLEAKVDFVVAAYNNEMMGKAMGVARRLRQAGKTVDMYPEVAKKVAKAFNHADKVGAMRIAFVAPDEYNKGLVRVKDLRNFGKDISDEEKSRDVPLDDLANVDRYFGMEPTSMLARGPGVCSSSGHRTACASSGGSAPKGGEEAFLQEHPYLAGFRPSKHDAEHYAELRRTTGRPSSPALERWYGHIETFTVAQRAAW